MSDYEALWAHHHALWRDPAAVIPLWDGAQLDPQALAYETSGDWWGVLARANVTLIVTREYEHFALSLGVSAEATPVITALPLPHPSGAAYDAARGELHLACTRNPNQVITFKPWAGAIERLDMPFTALEGARRPLMPTRAAYYPGSLYMHDLAMIDGALYANSVGQNAIIRLYADGSHERVWHPRAIEQDGAPVFGQNHIQLNSIAAGATLEDSYFSASADEVTTLRPGHADYPVDRRGVIFSGRTREPIARGLTRPHSARLYDGRVWVDNSGYGELCIVEPGRDTPTVVARLPGWTRGLGFAMLDDGTAVAFVGTSRVIPRFRQYAPGLEVESSVCGVHAVDLVSGAILASITWAVGNQIFAIEPVPAAFTSGFAFDAAGARDQDWETRLFYAYKV